MIDCLRAICVLSLVWTTVHSQWIFPFPLPEGQAIQDYTSGRLKTDLNFASGDSMETALFTSDVPQYIVARCSNISAEYDKGKVSDTLDEEYSAQGFYAKDGTWTMLPYFSSSNRCWAYPPGETFFTTLGGRKDIWAGFMYSIPVTNTTTGPLCWFEISTGTGGSVSKFNETEEEDTKQEDPNAYRTCRVSSTADPQHHFVTTPFLIGAQRPEGAAQVQWQFGNDGKLAYKWKNGTVSDNFLKGTTKTISFSNRPTGAPGSRGNSGSRLMNDGWYLSLGLCTVLSLLMG